MERENVEGVCDQNQFPPIFIGKWCPHVRALYSQPQSTASAENEIKY